MRVADEYLKQAGVLDKLKKMFFKNKDTGNKVKFDSLPQDQKDKIKSDAEKKEDNAESGESKSPLSNAQSHKYKPKKNKSEIKWDKPSELSDSDLADAIYHTKNDFLRYRENTKQVGFNTTKDQELSQLWREDFWAEEAERDLKEKWSPVVEEYTKRDKKQGEEMKDFLDSQLQKMNDHRSEDNRKKKKDKKLLEAYKDYYKKKKEWYENNTSRGKKMTDKKSTLRSSLVRLAYEKPELRKDILPLVRTKVAKSPRKKWENPNNGRSKVVYVEAILDNPKQLLSWWENNVKDYMGAGDPVPLLDTKVAHHMTIAYGGNNPGIPLAEVEQMGIGGKVQLEVIGYDYSDKVQAVLVKPKGTSSSNRYPHITVAVGNGGKPADSNDLLARRNIKDAPRKITLSATVGYFGRGKHHTQIDWESE